MSHHSPLGVLVRGAECTKQPSSVTFHTHTEGAGQRT